MRVVIAGGHGQIALLLEKRLADAGHDPVALVRNPDHERDVHAVGATPVVLDLESASVTDVTHVLRGADAVVFAAGAGPGSTAERKETVDRAGAVLLADAASAAGVARYVMVSSMGTEKADPTSDDVFQVYLRAKAAADADLRGRSDLVWTIVRPGRLTDDSPTGHVTVGASLPSGSIPRADVADVLLSVLESPAPDRRQFDVVAGETPVRDAVASLISLG
ncbi:SDR family oxidoreductase [Phycicoccus sp. M110.8]|uniref:SDR family oxidoreductase n=1 Tax=Phycicoccus sp. M110.8 TaxID=3075433 RepID=UPI0028FDBED9|nr:SDR family oxidoreductase [Phycicoccus sp. M110.8]MDU0315478.1 SDR family oxidoreductase [Phycicoccus sp. M110.8]